MVEGPGYVVVDTVIILAVFNNNSPVSISIAVGINLSHVVCDVINKAVVMKWGCGISTILKRRRSGDDDGPS